MVGLSILLEAYQKKSTVTTTNTTKNPQVINKTISIKPSLPSYLSSSSSSSSLLPSNSFLDSCYLCKQRILPGKDIYMYKGDRAFCSVECRCRQIYMDEEDSINVSRQKHKCSFAAINSSTSSSSSSTHHHQRKGNKNNRANGFAY